MYGRRINLNNMLTPRTGSSSIPIPQINSNSAMLPFSTRKIAEQTRILPTRNAKDNTNETPTKHDGDEFFIVKPVDDDLFNVKDEQSGMFVNKNLPRVGDGSSLHRIGNQTSWLSHSLMMLDDAR